MQRGVLVGVEIVKEESFARGAERGAATRRLVSGPSPEIIGKEKPGKSLLITH